MRKLYLLFILTTTLLSCSEYQSEDLKEYNLKGKVNTLKSIKYIAVEEFGEVVEGKRSSRNKSDELDMRYSNISLEYDQNGKCEWLTYFDRNGEVELKASAKDSILTFYSSDGDLMLKSIGNDASKPTEVSSYNPNGELELKLLLRYDDENNLVEEREYSSDGKLIRSSNYQYDKNNNISEENRLEIEENWLFINNYDTLKSVLSYGYNENKDVVDFEISQKNKKAQKKYVYEYDDRNNWTQRIEYNGIVPKYIVEREIEYYN